MDNVTPLKPKKKAKRIGVTVTWGGFQILETSSHVASKDPHIDTDTGVLVVTEGDAIICYPIGSVFKWTEGDIPDAEN